MSFDEQAAAWDTKERAMRAKRIAEQIDFVIGDRKYRHALDFGAGTGLISFSLTNAPEKITLLDSSSEMLRVASEKQIATNAHLEILCADIVEKDCLTDKYDLIYSSMVFHLVRDIEAAMETLSSHLENAGKMIIVDLVSDDGAFHRDDTDFDGHNGFEAKTFVDIMMKLGYTDISSEISFSGWKNKTVPYSLFMVSGIRRI